MHKELKFSYECLEAYSINDNSAACFISVAFMISQLKILNETKRTRLLHPASATFKGVKEIRLLTPKLMIAAKQLNDAQLDYHN